MRYYEGKINGEVVGAEYPYIVYSPSRRIIISQHWYPTQAWDHMWRAQRRNVGPTRSDIETYYYDGEQWQLMDWDAFWHQPREIALPD